MDNGELIKISDEVIGFSILIPSSWKGLNKEAFAQYGIDPRTLFVFILPDGNQISVMYDTKCSQEQFEELYNLNINNMRNAGYDIHNEAIINGRGKTIRQALVDIKTENGILRICHNFLIIKGYFVNFSGEIDSTIDKQDMEKLMNEKSMMHLYNLIMSIEEK